MGGRAMEKFSIFSRTKKSMTKKSALRKMGGGKNA